MTQKITAAMFRAMNGKKRIQRKQLEAKVKGVKQTKRESKPDPRYKEL